MRTRSFTEEQIQKAIQLVREKNTVTMIMQELNVGYTDVNAVLNELERRGVIKRTHPTSLQLVVVQ